MEPEERPRKFRKLGAHESAPADEDHVPLPLNVNEAANESVDASPPANSKPNEPAANLAEPGKDEVDSSEDDLGAAPKPQRQRDPDPAEHERLLLQRHESSEDGPPLSKNQLKKLRKREEWEAGRDYRKARRKQKNQDKKARKRDAREEEAQQLQLLQQHSLATERHDETPSTTASRPAQPPTQKPKYRRPVQLPITILIDCGFDQLMMEKERISLGSQITRAYSDNHRGPYQAHLVLSSWGGLLKERFDTVLNKHYLNWKGVRFEGTDFVNAANQMAGVMTDPKIGGKLVGCFQKFAATATAPGDTEFEDGREPETEIADSKVPNGTIAHLDNDSELSVTVELNEKPLASENPESAQKDNVPSPTDPPPATSSSIPPPPIPQGETIYLTSDSPHTLSTLSPYSTYIIGGLVDKNRHKGICYKTACDRGIKTAKLPIGEYLEMSGRKVLATNHVVEILLRWLEEASGPQGEEGAWGRAFLRVIPKRKGGKLRGDTEGGDGEEEVEDAADIDGNAREDAIGDEEHHGRDEGQLNQPLAADRDKQEQVTG
ncbi:tRNA (guanine(9)-N(1))-methyltransferase [Cladophialophora chaetospira]|uniref:tRNA (guanine(9)-N1)-methyltransferase n=1 Tax=Cladophialophora chaetospira TaxID=386627 RepID=A0AA38XEK7_9EURO|nr:tRNA (guanine(9)-N(1))-methyltransferase [Cladophialophora chaetospira]